MKSVIKFSFGLILCLQTLYSADTEARTIYVTPGSLWLSLDSISAPSDSLILKGSADARDLKALATHKHSIEILDMRALKIESYIPPFKAGGENRCFEENSLPSYLFFNSDLKKVFLPSLLKVIPEGTFASASIEEIMFPPSLEQVSDFAFSSCKYLRSLNLPSSLKIIGKGAFRNCTSLQTVNFPESLQSIDDEAFRNTKLSNVNLPATTASGRFVFADIPSLSSASTKQDISNAEGIFLNCNSLKSVETLSVRKFPPLFTALSPYVSIESNTISSSQIGEYAFAGNNAEKLIFFSKPDSIAKGAFAYMPFLKEIDVTTLKDNIPDTDTLAFEGNSYHNIILRIDSVSENIWANTIPWRYFNICTVSTSVPVNKTDSEELAVKIAGKTLYITSPTPWIRLEIFNIAGLHIVSSRSASSASLQIPSKNMTTYIIQAFYPGDKTKNIKILM